MSTTGGGKNGSAPSPARIRTVYNGVDPANFPALDGEPELPTISWVGRIDPIKDLETLLRAFAIVRASCQRPGCACSARHPTAGSPTCSAARRWRPSWASTALARFEGRVENIRDAYDAGSIVALSSVSEGFPYSLIEAMTCGRACVATDVGGVTEAVGDTGLVVPPRSPEPMARGLPDPAAGPATCGTASGPPHGPARWRTSPSTARSARFDEIYSFLGAGRPLPVARPAGHPTARQPGPDDDLLPWRAAG